jgi:hypothetical protein
MDIIIAIAHILGSIIVVILFSVFIMYIGSIQVDKYKRQLEMEASISLGIRIEDLNKDENSAKVLGLSAKKFASDLFQNRLSDLCGVITTLWGWFGNLVQISVFIGACWYTFSENLDNAIYSWSLVVVSVLLWVIHMAFSLLCRLFTGRYPGEAKEARKGLAEWVKENRISQE